MAKREASSDRPARPRWEFDERIPTHDFLQSPLTKMVGIESAVDDFVFSLERGYFLMWEAVVCEEQGLPLTARQEEALGELITFDKDADDEILYIDELSRPSEPWDVILNKIAPHLLIVPFRTFEIHCMEQCEGWPSIVGALSEHGDDLSLPPGVNSPIEVVPADLRHRLWLQSCIDALSGLGQEEELNLTDQPWRIETFITYLREFRESIEYLDLTLESLLETVILPDRDRPLFIEAMQKELGLKSMQDKIADHLRSEPGG